ncbi:hypothetical protein [Streptomyces sp. WMMC1477]|uniref:hypothetical protein n=1 Tax=Streptomyces sp. WMMC1477 TaxID=3015155 RepID=UPI0022B6AB3B|nr:hypothetical protein [Streptomyces sp. WMMC1477]MCZ7430111.1 hypothetical protein [Streptomyces sp. WMMC1477]
MIRIVTRRRWDQLSEQAGQASALETKLREETEARNLYEAETRRQADLITTERAEAAAVERFWRRELELARRQVDPMAGAEGLDVVAAFTTRGGAAVVLHRCEFTSRYEHYRGAPYAAKELTEISGTTWRCLGCGAVGKDTGDDPGYRSHRQDTARNAANEHAGNCWSTPLPQTKKPGGDDLDDEAPF